MPGIGADSGVRGDTNLIKGVFNNPSQGSALSSREKDGLSELFEEVAKILKRAGFNVSLITFPHERRSIDLVGYKDGLKVILKVVDDAEKVDNQELRDLSKSERVYDTSAIIVSNKCDGEELEDDVVYVKSGVNVLSPQLLRKYFVDNERPLIAKMKGSYLLRLDSRILAEKRREMGLSRGEVADILKISRKAVYLYERGEIMISLEKAIELARLFGEDIFKEIDILVDRFIEARRGPEADEPRDRIEKRLWDILGSRASYIYRFSRTPLDISARCERPISIIKSADARLDEEKVENAEKMAASLGSRLVIVNRESDLKELEKLFGENE